MKNLWADNLRGTTIEDLENFCTRPVPSEGARLDFKGTELPKDIEKTISAMANTHGGLILLGIEGDGANRAKWPPESPIKLDGLADTISQKANQAIYPPVPIELSDPIRIRESGGIIVVRVPESWEAPHAVNNKRRFYVRRNSINDKSFNEDAQIDRLEAMFARRSRLLTVQHREYEKILHALHAVQDVDKLTGQIWLSISILPTMLTEPLCTLNHLNQLRMCQDSYVTASNIPRGREVVFRSGSETPVFYWRVTVDGVYTTARVYKTSNPSQVANQVASSGGRRVASCAIHLSAVQALLSDAFDSGLRCLHDAGLTETRGIQFKFRAYGTKGLAVEDGKDHITYSTLPISINEVSIESSTTLATAWSVAWKELFATQVHNALGVYNHSMVGHLDQPLDPLPLM